MTQRIGIIGGSFDPIHMGHLTIARDACQQFSLDRVLFLPAYQSPLKSNRPNTSPEQRLAMVQAAIAHEPAFEASDLEFSMGEISYSVDTARALKKRYPQDSLFWILGADQLQQLHHWRDIEILGQLLEFIAFQRPGSAFHRSPELPDSVRIHPAAERAIEISSSEIRDCLKSGLPAKHFLPAPVFDYIKAQNLYGATDSSV